MADFSTLDNTLDSSQQHSKITDLLQSYQEENNSKHCKIRKTRKIAELTAKQLIYSEILDISRASNKPKIIYYVYLMLI